MGQGGWEEGNAGKEDKGKGGGGGRGPGVGEGGGYFAIKETKRETPRSNFSKNIRAVYGSGQPSWVRSDRVGFGFGFG